MSAELQWYLSGFVAGLSISMIVWVVAYHRGWKAGFKRMEDIADGKERW